MREVKVREGQRLLPGLREVKAGVLTFCASLGVLLAVAAHREAHLDGSVFDLELMMVLADQTVVLSRNPGQVGCGSEERSCFLVRTVMFCDLPCIEEHRSEIRLFLD